MDDSLLYRYLPIIKTHYPDIKKDDIQFLTSGYNHDVCVVYETNVFRFPKHEISAKLDQVENEFLCEFAAMSPVPIQEMDSHHDPETGLSYQTYQFLPGVPLSSEKALTLSPEKLIHIAKTIGTFLTRLHMYPREKAEVLGMHSIGDSATYGMYFRDVIAR